MSGAARTQAAVTSYRATLEIYIRDRVPLDWGGTRYNVASTLVLLAERDGTPRR